MKWPAAAFGNKAARSVRRLIKGEPGNQLLASHLVSRYFEKPTFVIALIFAIAPVANGGLIGEPSWIVGSEDGRFRLVMLQFEREWLDPNDLEDIELKKKFSRSGVYEGDKFLWPIPYYPPAYEVVFTSDGNHVLLAQTSTEHTISNIPPGAELIIFHRDKDPDIWPEYEIVWGWGLKTLIFKCMKRYRWLKWKATTFDSIAGTFTITTNHAEEFVFDIRAGKKIRTRSAWNVGVATFVLLVPLLIFGSGRLGLLRTDANWRSKIWQVSLGEMLLLATVTAVILTLSKLSLVFPAAVVSIGAIGGGIAQFRTRGRRSFWIGSILSVYGLVLGLIVFAVLCEPLIWRHSCFQSSLTVITMLVGCIVVGTIAGALTGGALARRFES